MEAALGGLGAHSPSRTLILRRHDADRLDAEASIECELWDAAGRVGFCHDQVTLTATTLGSGTRPRCSRRCSCRTCPRSSGFPIRPHRRPDPLLLERAQQILVDSTRDASLAAKAGVAHRKRCACTT